VKVGHCIYSYVVKSIIVVTDVSGECYCLFQNIQGYS
jgi:hypothetical protein